MFSGSSKIKSLLGDIPPDMSIVCIPEYLNEVKAGTLVIIEDICTLAQIEMVLKQEGEIVTAEKAREEISRQNKPLFQLWADPLITKTAADEAAQMQVQEDRLPIANAVDKDKLNLPGEMRENRPVTTPNIILPPQKRGQIIAAKSTKGGVGKSTTGANTAAYYSLQQYKTCFIDLDIGKGNAATMLKLKCTGPTVATWQKFERLSGVGHSSGFHFIPWGIDPNYMANESEIADLIRKAAGEFDYVVLDYGVHPTLAMVGLEMADQIYLIANQTESMLHDFVEFFIKEYPNLTAKSELVINRETPGGYYKAAEVARKSGFSSYYVIPEDPESSLASEKTGKTFVQMPGSKAGQAFIRMLGGAIEEPKKKRFGFLRR